MNNGELQKKFSNSYSSGSMTMISVVLSRYIFAS